MIAVDTIYFWRMPDGIGFAMPSFTVGSIRANEMSANRTEQNRTEQNRTEQNRYINPSSLKLGRSAASHSFT